MTAGYPEVLDAYTGRTGAVTLPNAASIPMPSVVNANDLLFVTARSSPNATLSTPDDWTSISGMAWVKRATGAEGGTNIQTFPDTNVNGVRYICLRIGADSWPWTESITSMVVGALAVDSGTDWDPPSLNPAFSQRPTLWLAFLATETAGLTVSDIPDNYGDAISGISAQSPSIYMVRRELNADSENPSTFTVSPSAASGRAVTMAIAGHELAGTGAPVLPGLRANGAATAEPFATGNIELPLLRAAGVAAMPMHAIAAAMLPRMRTNGIASRRPEGEGGATLRTLQATASGERSAILVEEHSVGAHGAATQRGRPSGSGSASFSR